MTCAGLCSPSQCSCGLLGVAKSSTLSWNKYSTGQSCHHWLSLEGASSSFLDQNSRSRADCRLAQGLPAGQRLWHCVDATRGSGNTAWAVTHLKSEFLECLNLQVFWDSIKREQGLWMAPGWVLPFFYFPSCMLFSDPGVLCHFCYSACSKNSRQTGATITVIHTLCRSSGKPGQRAGWEWSLLSIGRERP